MTAEALLDEAAVRFDFSQYTDIEDMVDVNGAWGPLDISGWGFVGSAAFNADGLRLITDGGHPSSFGMTLSSRINGVPGPLEIGPNGLTFLEVNRWDSDRPVAEARLRANFIEVVCDAFGEFRPDFDARLEVPCGGIEPPDFTNKWLLKVKDGPPDYDSIAEEDDGFITGTPVGVHGVFMVVLVVDVAGRQTRYASVTPVVRFDQLEDFAAVATFESTTIPIDYFGVGSSAYGDDRTFVESAAWNRPLTPAEVDTLVAHFTAPPIDPHPMSLTIRGRGRTLTIRG